MQINSKQIKVFIDFDGTITLEDVGDALFKEFSQFEPYITQLINKEITIEQYYLTVCSFLPEDLSKEDIIKFSEKFEIDSNFIKFIAFCKNEGIETTIISDGFNTYIDPILNRYDVDSRYFANSLSGFGSKIKPIFNNASESCLCPSASCKRNIMLGHLGEDEIAVYIGDGLSDFCAASFADIVFAKHSLAAHCNLMKIPHYPYSNFFDVYRIFGSLLKKGKIRKRHQAELLRKKAYETE